MAKGQKAGGLEKIVDQVLAHPLIFVFAEFIDLVKVQQINAKVTASLELFAYGTYPDYLKEQDKYISLKPAQINKLKLLTLVDLSSKQSQVTYASLMQATLIKEKRELEDQIIECF